MLLRIPLEDIVTATNNFSQENLLKRGGNADVYKGLLLTHSKDWIQVVIRKFGHLCGTSEFYGEIEIIASLRHRNVVSLIGFCDEKNERMIVMECALNGSLDKYLSDPTVLTWSQRLDICFGAALALKSIHFYIHGIRSFKILLNKDWEAKVLHCIESKSSWYDTKNSYVYSMGVILLEVLYGRKATIEDVIRYLAHKELDDHMIDPNLRKQMVPKSLSIILETAYDCLNEKPYQQRPYMYQIVKKLKEAFEIQWKHENLSLMEKFTYLKIPLMQIMIATNNFYGTYCIKSDRYYTVYKAELNHSDIESALTSEGALPKKRVVIKRFNVNKEKTTKDFFTEVEVLSSCKHPNILSFLGFCYEDSEMIVVSECDGFKQSLNDYLGSNSQTNLTWEQRIRICLDISHGLQYLHKLEGKPSMIYQENPSEIVLLDEKCTAKIVDFTLLECNSYPTYFRGWDKRRVIDDIYFLGAFLFGILSGKLAYSFYENNIFGGFAFEVRQHFDEGKLEKIIDLRILKETHECGYTLRKGPNQDSINTFTKIAYQCLEETPRDRPTLEVIIKSLEIALDFQHAENLEHLKIPLKDIESATETFDKKYLIGLGGYGAVYKAQLNHFDIRSSLETKTKTKAELHKIRSIVAIKRIFGREDDRGKEGFFAEIVVLSKCNHPNIVSLLGFCVEGSEMLLVYEHASNGSLDDYLGSIDNVTILTWAQRLKMCIDIAQGLKYLHTNTKGNERIIHRDIKSANILLGENWEAKIADFGLSKLQPLDQQGSTINTSNIAGTNVYLDPEYAKTGRLKKASDIYSFGVVLFEIFSGTLAYDSKYIWENGNGLAPIAQRHFENGTLKEILDPKIRDEAHELTSNIKVGPDSESLYRFSKIAYQCLAKTQAERPKIEEVIKELKEALKFQENRKDAFKFSLEDIRSGVGNFSVDNRVTRGFGMLYKGEVKCINVHKKVVVKRFNKSGQVHGFLREFEVLFKHKHKNIIGLVGYCKELDEKIIIYEHASNGSLCSYLNNSGVSWITRLKICIDIAKGLNFLHGGDAGPDVVIHRDIKSSNVLLTEDWKAKICGFDVCLTYPKNQVVEHAIADVVGSPGYCDPLYWKTLTLTKESDIYSFGVILFEIMCGRLAYVEDFTDYRQFLDAFVKCQFQATPDYDIVFEGIKDQIVRESLVTFQNIAFQCLHEKREKRPTAGEVVVQLHKALELQEAYEIWEAKLPKNYKDILQFSKSPDAYSTMGKKDIYNILSNGILLQDGKMWVSIGHNGERKEMISARMFSYKNRWSHRWRSIQGSRFQKVAEMLDVSNLNIQIKIRPLLLPSDVTYSVHLVFKFCGPRKSHAKRMYVNLKYKIGNENLHAYFATWREDDWMMIELCRFSNDHKKDTKFEILLEGFSRCYCDSRAIYIEGIEFQAIDNVKQEKTEKVEETQQVLMSPSETKQEFCHMVSAEKIEFEFSNVTLLESKSSNQCSGEKIYNVPRRSVFCIRWDLNRSQMVSPKTECACYLVFKLSENCKGLHCPVIVRDQFCRKSKKIVYFRPPSPWNVHDIDQVPKKRRDGWMEVIVSKFNSDFVLKRGCLLGKLKLVCYEGTMFGLTIRGLEFRLSE